MAKSPPSSIGTWTLNEELGKGAFSTVHAATRGSNALSLPSMVGVEWVLKISPAPTAAPSKKGRAISAGESGASLLAWENTILNGFAKGHGCFPLRPLGRDAYGEDKGWRFLALERIRGGNLEELLETSGGALPPALCWQITLRLFDGLKVLHDKGLAYRDLKPQNVMIPISPESGNVGVVLVDFGTCRKFKLVNGEDATGESSPVGTPKFMGIHAHNCAPPCARDDLESLGYLLWWMLRGGVLDWDGATSLAEVYNAKLRVSFQSVPHLATFVKSVRGLKTTEKPSYDELRRLLAKGAAEAGSSAVATPTVLPRWLDFDWTATATKKATPKKRKAKAAAASPRVVEAVSSPPRKPEAAPEPPAKKRRVADRTASPQTKAPVEAKPKAKRAAATRVKRKVADKKPPQESNEEPETNDLVEPAEEAEDEDVASPGRSSSELVRRIGMSLVFGTATAVLARQVL